MPQKHLAYTGDNPYRFKIISSYLIKNRQKIDAIYPKIEGKLLIVKG